MGRTTQTMTQLVAQEEACWAPFRRALRKEDQQIFDRLFAAARHHSAPAHYASHSTPFDSILLAMVLETMKAVEALGRRLDALTGEDQVPRLGEASMPHPGHSEPSALNSVRTELIPNTDD